MDPLGKAKDLVKAFSLLPTAQRAVLLGASAFGLLGVFLGVSHLASGPQYATVFTGLTPNDASSITSILQKDHIPYQVLAAGTAVAVPQGQTDKARIDVGMTPQSLPPDFSLFDKSQLANSNFQNQVQYLQALEGELDRTILSMQQISDARVAIVLPKTGLFQGQSTPATAAVFLKVKPWDSLSPAQVQGIVALVSHSVQGLSAKNVTVINGQGEILGSGAATQASAQSQALAAKAAFEQHLEGNLSALLTPIFGPGNVAATVNAQLSQSSSTVVKKMFSPPAKGPLATHLNQLKQTVTGSPPAASGVPGTGSNVPTYQAAGGGSGGSSSTTKLVQTNDVNSTQVTTHITPGAVRRLTVAVVVNRNLTPQAKTALMQTVSNAIGIDPARKDSISVSGMAFNTSLQKSVQQQQAAAQRQNLIRLGAELAALLGGLVLLFVFARRALSLLERRQAPSPAPVGVPGRPPGEVAAEPLAQERRQLALRDVVLKDPKVAADVIQTWIREE